MNKALSSQIIATTDAVAAESVPIGERAQPPARARGSLFHPELWLVASLVGFALVVRLWNLEGVPDTLLADEADNAQDSLRITYGSIPRNGFFGFDWTAQPAYSAYLLAAFIKLFGFSISVIRLPSALISTLALIPFYLLLRRQFAVSTSLLTTLLLATNVWYLNFSRSGWNNIHVCFYMLMAMLFLMLGLDAIRARPARQWSQRLYFGAAGFFCALGLYGYPSGRAIILAMVAFSPIALWFYRRYWKQLLLGYAVTIITAGVAFAPQGLFILENWEWFNGRSKVVALINNPQYQADPIGTLWSQLERNVRGPWDGSVNNTAQYSPGGEPQLETVTGLLVLAGMGLSLLLPALRKRPENWLWWVMLLVAWSATQILTVGTPNGARGIVYMPTLLYFAAAVIELPIRAAGRLPRPARWLPVTAAAVVLVLVAYGNVTHYAQWQSEPRTRQARYIYITAREFPRWASEVTERVRTGQGSINVGQWRDEYPVKDISTGELLLDAADAAPATPAPSPTSTDRGTPTPGPGSP